MDLSKVSNIVFDGVDYSDYPDFCDAYIVSADYEDREATEADIEEINENRDFIHEKLIDNLF